ncbi:hypothetical protein EH30_04705 [Erythrobacter sp. JL475]|nr:hypothetical protein EH30_04705 [Erythrobacter sp. JL475]
MAALKLYETIDIWSEARRLLVSAKGTLGAYLVIMTLSETVVDRFPEIVPVGWAGSAIMLFMSYWLTINMLYFGGLAPGGVQKGLFAFLGLTFLYAIVIGLGWVALVFPAFYFGIRFSAVLGYGMGETGDFRDAFGRSWNATKGHFWEIAGALFVPLVLSVISFSIIGSWADKSLQVPIGAAIASNFFAAATGATLIAIGVGVYAAARTRV